MRLNLAQNYFRDSKLGLFQRKKARENSLFNDERIQTFKIKNQIHLIKSITAKLSSVSSVASLDRLICIILIIF